MLLNGSTANAQYQLSLEGNATAGINQQPIHLQKNVIETRPFVGYELNLLHNFETRFKSFVPSVRTGFRFLQTTGTINDLEFSVQTYRIHLHLGGRYHFHERFSVGLFYGVENNLDFEDFRTQTPDLLRHSLLMDANYHFHDRWSAYLGYQRALSPSAVHYFITNPKHLFRVGISYQIL